MAKKRNSTHPGVSLSQKVMGGVYYVRWFHPRETKDGRPTQKLNSTETNDVEIARRIAEELYRLINNRDHWESPTDGLHPRTYQLWGVKGLKDRANAARIELDDPLLVLGPPSAPGAVRFVCWDGKERNLEDLKKEISEILRTVETLKQERDKYRDDAHIAQGELRKMGHRMLRDKSAQYVQLGKAKETWLSKFQGRDADYKKSMQWDIERFIEQFGEKTTVAEMAGREVEVDDWLRSLTKKVKKPKAQKKGTKTDAKDSKAEEKFEYEERPLGGGRRRELRRVILRFLTDSGLDPDRKGIHRPGVKDVRNDRSPIRWLTKDQATSVKENLKQPWQDYFRVQLGLGLRPDELITLKRSDFDQKFETVTLSPLEHLTLKEGSRSIRVPGVVREIVKRRLASAQIVFPMVDSKRGRAS